MGYYTALITEWATLTGTTAQKLAALNAMTVAGPNVDVPVSAVVGYLALNGKMGALQKYAASPPPTTAGLAAGELTALLMCPNAPAFATSNPAAATVIAGFLNALAGDTNTGITSTDVSALLALAATTVPWWKANGYTSAFTVDDLVAAGGLT